MSSPLSDLARAKLKRPRTAEKVEQRLIIRLACSLGMVVASTSQSRASMQHEGLPDLWIFDPKHSRAFWWETKATDGVQSVVQQEFQEACELCRVGCGIGTLTDFANAVGATVPGGERWAGKRSPRPKIGRGG